MDLILEIDDEGTMMWRLNDKLHREDGPAVVRSDGTKRWYLNGVPHRTDGPAVIYADGTEIWYLNNELHRLDGPAVTHYSGIVRYFAFGVRYESLEDLTIGTVMNQ